MQPRSTPLLLALRTLAFGPGFLASALLSFGLSNLGIAAAQSVGTAAKAAPITAPAKDARSEILRKFPDAKPEDIRPSPVSGVFEVSRGADFVYVTADGKYVFAGDLYDLSSDATANLSERRRREVRARLLAAVPDSQALVFSPRNPKFTVTVFTDVDCSYCRKMHSEIAQYIEQGIRVRYLFFPRSGPGSEGWDKAVQVWCSPNRNDAFTRAKRGENLKTAKCGQNPVARDFNLAQDLGLRGTPQIFLPNGELLPGYVPPVRLAGLLQAAR
jgi:thiol:disulfide interchange protein DsbC